MGDRQNRAGSRQPLGAAFNIGGWSRWFKDDGEIGSISMNSGDKEVVRMPIVCLIMNINMKMHNKSNGFMSVYFLVLELTSQC